MGDASSVIVGAQCDAIMIVKCDIVRYKYDTLMCVGLDFNCLISSPYSTSLFSRFPTFFSLFFSVPIFLLFCRSLTLFT